MARRDNNQAKPTPAGKALVLSPKTAARVLSLLEKPPLEPDPTQFNQYARAGKVFFRLRELGPGEDGRRGGGGRFIPYIGGDDRTKLYVSPGTVTYVPIASENRDDDDDQPRNQQVEPLFPKIDGTALDAEETPSFSVGDKSNLAVWLCAQRLRCSSELPTESDSERLELVNRGEKPEEVEGEIHRLLFEADLEDIAGGGKALKNIDQRIASDVDVHYLCEESQVSEEDTSEFDSDDLQSSELEDVPDGSSESGSDPECPWHMEARWYNQARCYPHDPDQGSVTIGALVAIDLGPMFRRCRNWYAYISMANGIPKGARLNPDYDIVGLEIKVPLTKRRTINIKVPFFFTPTPCMTDQTVTVRLTSQQKEGVEEEDECCGDAAGEKTVSIGLWPGWCEYGGTCNTTTVLPP